MSTNVSAVVSHFPDAENGLTTTTAGSVASGATTVTLNSVAGYTNGEPVVFVIDPTDTTKKQTFTGIMDTAGVQVTSVVWTAGTNQTHALGATVVDYATATHIAMISKGILVHSDQDGTLKAGAVDVAGVIASGIITDTQMATAVKPVTIASETTFDFVASGCVWTADAAGSTRVASMTAGVVYIGGVRVVVSAVVSRTFTASKDVYVDVGVNGTVDYVDVTTNAASQALEAGHIRLAIVVVGASSIAAAASVNQGEESRILPIASSIPYAVTDSLGNLICPRDPNRKILGYRQILSSFTGSGFALQAVTGLTCPVIVPTGRKVKVSVLADAIGGTTPFSSICDGTVTAGTTIATTASVAGGLGVASVPVTPSTSSKTYIYALSGSGGTVTATAATTAPAYVLVELA